MTIEPITTGPNIIVHRVNTIEKLHTIPLTQGIEFDIRDGPSGIIVTHDPWDVSIKFEDFLPHIFSRFCIINVKSEGIEYKTLELLEKYGVSSFFFLDCSFPMIMKLARKGIRNIAVRVSEYESIETAKKMRHLVDWVWLDSFTSAPTIQMCRDIRSLGYKICLVSPELQGRNEDTSCLLCEIDAVCTKYPETWSL